MTDFLVFWIAFAVAGFLWPISRTGMGLPRLRQGEPLGLPDPAELQAEYDRKARWRYGARVATVVFAVYFLFRSVAESGDPDGVSGSFALLLMPLATLAAGLVVMTVLRSVRERRIAASHPLFTDSLTPLALRVLSLLVVAVALGLLASGALKLLPIDPLIAVGGALVFLVLGQRLILAAMLRLRREYPLDSPLGRRIAEVGDAFGFRPKQVVLIPNMVANGMAFPNGSVVVTTALLHVLDEEEVAAVLAHEMSHARDRDAKKLMLRMRLGWIGLIAVTTGISTLTAIGGVPLQAMLPFVLMVAACVQMGIRAVYCRFSRHLEFKCDADVVRFGYGSAFEVALEKLHLAMGVPARWAKSDAPFMTHPDLETRLAAIRSLAPAELTTPVV